MGGQRVSHLTGQARPRRKSGEVFGCSGEVFVEKNI